MSLDLAATRFSAAPRFGAVAENQQESTIRARAKEAFGLNQIDLVVDRTPQDTWRTLFDEFIALRQNLKPRVKQQEAYFNQLKKSGLDTKPPFGDHNLNIVTHLPAAQNPLEYIADGIARLVAGVMSKLLHIFGKKKSGITWETQQKQPDGSTLKRQTNLRLSPKFVEKLHALPDGGQLKLRQFGVILSPEDPSAIEVQAKSDSEAPKPAQENKPEAA